MEGFLNVLAYWLTPLAILFLEHIIWRREYAYDITVWQAYSELPQGLAASSVFLISTVLTTLYMS